MAEDDFLLKTLLSAMQRGEPVARVVVVRGEGTGQWAVVSANESAGWDALRAGEDLLNQVRAALAQRHHVTLEYEARSFWVEVMGAPPTLLVVGAGHLAEPLATIGKLCDFRVAILDDRPQFANRNRFPQADDVVAAPFTQALKEFPFNQDTYVVLVTRGHSHDVECLVEVLDRPHAYIGMVGSRRRVKAVRTLLETEQGIAAEALSKVHAPIGLDIGSESPAEIAVAILAEIIMVRRGGSGAPLRDALMERGSRVHTGRIQRNKRNDP